VYGGKAFGDQRQKLIKRKPQQALQSLGRG
jgi:hypothetical protein